MKRDDIEAAMIALDEASERLATLRRVLVDERAQTGHPEEDTA